MTESNGHQQVSYATDEPASGELDYEIAMAELVRVRLAGLGRMGCFHAANLVGRIPGARLVRVPDAAENMARENAARLGRVEWSTRYEGLLEAPDIEAIIIASPTHLQAEMIEPAAAASKHIFCEKPVAHDLERTYDVIETMQVAGVKLQVGFHRRFDPDYRVAKEKISAGHIGEVYLFRTTPQDMRSPGFDYIRGSGGFFADVTVHDFDAARWLVGEISEVTAAGAALSDPGFEEVGDIDNAVITLRFASDALGVEDGALRTRCARRGGASAQWDRCRHSHRPRPDCRALPPGGENRPSQERLQTARSSTRRPIRALMQSIKAGAEV